ncbi:pimeloyl-ACP methyl ester esterase BioH [Tahibacter amnicola]|uniref:Pimeloyl-[acyl-carrier protein] methyl ester esterase n=2 Tax=Tahibacter amnicola TaxID=2976241 RepID=A0ABY6BL32_9GAMM|nr:pimeloyl-ACP methyl ester esterase BioH [Tahibacter amnicola]UXI70604.1 pimeloyl-ACP methyl ester esterase BioH [Tahibacter amnicola]
MHIETLGHGPDLVLIHGWAMHSGIFAPLTERLSAAFRLHLVDLPGHGRSADREASLDPTAFAREVAAAVPPALWIGWSLGGLVCLEAARLMPGTVRGVCLIAASPRFVVADDWPHAVSADVFRQFAEGLRKDYHRTIDRFLALEAHGSDHAQSELRELKAHVFDRGEPALQVLCEGLGVLEQTDLRGDLPDLRVPSLWIAGRRDRLIPAAAMRWSAQTSPQGRYLETAAGHAPFIAHGDEVAAAIRSFHAEISA